VRRWSSAYPDIPEECITEEIEDAVLDIAPFCIRFMKQTPARCIKAIKLCPFVLIDGIDPENLTSDMLEHLESLPEKTYESIKKMIEKKNLEYLY
jgi:hypothetical protein